MRDEFQYDVFLSHSAKDKTVVRELAERLRKDGLKVWFDESEIKPGDSIQARIEEGLEHSRVLVLCMSANAFGSDWAQLESQTFRFRDPLNKQRRFIPLRLDDTPIKGSLAQFLYINWHPAECDREYAKLADLSRSPIHELLEDTQVRKDEIASRRGHLFSNSRIRAYAFSKDGKRFFTCAKDVRVRLWDLETKRCLCIFDGHTKGVWSVAWSVDDSFAASGSNDGTVRLWDIEAGQVLRILQGHSRQVVSVAWSPNSSRVLSGSWDETIRMWNVQTGQCLRVFEGHKGAVRSLAWSIDKCHVLSGSQDKTLRLWNVETGECQRVFEGHTGIVWCVVWSHDRHRALSSSQDSTIRLWDIETGRCLRVLEGHTGDIKSVAWSDDERHAISCSWDKTVRLWDMQTGRCLRVLKGHKVAVTGVAWTPDQLSACCALKYPKNSSLKKSAA